MTNQVLWLCRRLLQRGNTTALFSNAFIASVGHALAAEPLDIWQVRNPLPPGISLNAVSYGNGQWVGVGFSGTIATSPDGITWTVRSSGTEYDLSGISYGDGRWVAVGSEGLVFSELVGWYNRGADGMMLTSTDGIKWTPRASGAPKLLTSISYGNGLWAAVGDGALLSSPDAVNWTVSSSNSGIYSCIGYGNERWALGAWNRFWQYTRITSHHLPNWRGTTPFGKHAHYLSAIIFANGLWMAVGDSGTILTSPDGFTWTRRDSGTMAILMGVSYGDGLWVAVGHDGSVLTSGKAGELPALSITISGMNAIVTWSAEAKGFVLESTTNPRVPENWTSVDDIPVVANYRSTITDALSGPSRFYRLRKP